MANTSSQSLFAQYASIIGNHAGTSYLDDPIKERLRLHRDGGLEIFYAPFDYVQPNAKLVIVGITPGRVQAENALKAAHAALRKGNIINDAERLAKAEGSFSGPMRSNLVAMLNHIGFNRYLNLSSCDDIFNPASATVHFTSALRYPVFVKGQNYNGQPDLMKTSALLQMVDEYLAAEAKMLPNAVWLPLGPKPSAAVRHLVKKGIIARDRVLDDMPHPSGANAERVAYFVGRKKALDLSAMTRPEPLDTARRSLINQVQALMETN